MNSREIVLNTLNGKNTERAPRQLWSLPWAMLNHGEYFAEIKRKYPDDIINIGADLKEKPVMVKGDAHEIGTFIDDFGCVFQNAQRGIIGEVKQPLVTEDDWSDSDKVHIPEEWLSFDIDEVNKKCAENADMFKIAGACPRPFERLQFIRGTENLYMDLMDIPSKMYEFIEKLDDFYTRILKKWAKTDVDALSIMDDWGSQNTLLINPKLWRTLFKPMYKKYIEIAHGAGKKMFMHSDGHTLEIYPDLIEIGLDAFNSQIFCMGVENLKQFRGKITFWGEIDRQYILPNGTVEDVAAAVTKVYDNLYDNGYCIAQCEFGPGAKPENVETVFRQWDALTTK